MMINTSLSHASMMINASLSHAANENKEHASIIRGHLFHQTPDVT
jgi:hypothetical protein